MGPAAAYYYHGLILDKGNEPSDHISAVHCVLAADELLNNSTKACLSFCLEAPIMRKEIIFGFVSDYVFTSSSETEAKPSQGRLDLHSALSLQTICVLKNASAMLSEIKMPGHEHKNGLGTPLPKSRRLREVNPSRSSPSATLRAPHELPDLPEFPLSLKPDEYELPDTGSMWESQKLEPEVQTLKEHLEDEEDEVENT
ncbi:hypothetical protein ACLOJK_019104 [Asimina triloba]